MVRNLLSSKSRPAVEHEKKLLTLELAEVREISDLIFKKLEAKIKVLEAMESSIDRKMASLERLIQRAEAMHAPGAGMNRQHEILALKERGLGTGEIAEILDMHVGEVELILELNVQRRQAIPAAGEKFSG